jgi:hypothetical protein
MIIGSPKYSLPQKDYLLVQRTLQVVGLVIADCLVYLILVALCQSHFSLESTSAKWFKDTSRRNLYTLTTSSIVNPGTAAIIRSLSITQSSRRVPYVSLGW